MAREKTGAGERGGQGVDARRRNPLETAVLVASSLLVAASIGVLAFQGTRDARPPVLETRVDSVIALGGVHHLHVTVHNGGDRSAAGALLRARLLRDTTVVAESEATIDWVPARSSASATLLFAEDPRDLEVEARVVGFTEP